MLIFTPLVDNRVVFASYPPSVLKWSFVDTPTIDNNVIVPSSEINRIAIGPEDAAIYAVDIPGSVLYKSINNGITWDNLVSDPVNNPLKVAGASMPVWDIAVSPDDVNFVVAITDGVGVPVTGPKNVFVSIDGGQNWQSTTTVVLGVNEFISCVAISPQYDIDKRYIAIATRGGTGNGRVFTYKAPGPSIWENQGTLPSGDVVALAFSPSYAVDTTVIVAVAKTDGFFLNIGTHDILSNTTSWKSGLGYPIKITASDGSSPNFDQIITADLELPYDFSGSDPGTLRRYFLSFDARTNIAPFTYFSGVYRIDDTSVFQLMYNTSLATSPDKRISSIAYWGTYDDGKLIAGESTTTATRGSVNTWLCLDPFTTTPPPGWQLSDTIKSPTGGGTSGRANAFLMWNTDGDRVYCGTGSADLSIGGTSLSLISGLWPWPGGLRNGSTPLDESAFSISLDIGDTWNQLSLIDTKIDFLSDVAVIEASEDSDDYSVLYLASINTSGAPNPNFDSVWRSTSDPLGMRWERILCTTTSNAGIILRPNPRISEDNVRSTVITFADLNTDQIYYSDDEGQYWEQLHPGVTITDFSLASDTVIYILNTTYVIKGTSENNIWKWAAKLSTGLTTGHTITTPLKNPKGKGDDKEDWVIVGSSIIGDVAWADFSKPTLKFEPPSNLRKRLPIQGDVHILTDEQFEANRTIYAATGNTGDGKIYRWIIGKSIEWDELEPTNSNFYGLVQRRSVLYGAYNLPAVPGAPYGVDRTLFPRAPVPPPPDWDDLTANLSTAVRFTLEPSSLKISGNTDNNLWAIDDTDFNWATKQGCLWNYTDILAKNGPWTTAPPSSGVIPVDPVTGRANEVNFAWRQLSYTEGYELQIAKDDKFTMRVLVDDAIIPANPLSPARILFPGLLEAGHKYFWRVRASLASTGEVIHSPWSATMYFTVMAGLPVEAKHLGPTLLQPPSNCTGCAASPAFSWSPMFQTSKYKFILAKDAALTHIVDMTTTATTAYQYQGKLETGVTYYWQVQAIKPVVSEPSPIGCFTVTDKKEPVLTSILGISDTTSLAAWIGIFVYAAFAVVMLVVILRTRYLRRHEED